MQCSQRRSILPDVKVVSSMTPWPGSALVSDVASSTEMLEQGEFGKLSGQIIFRPRCVKRNITEEETRLTVKRDCHLLPLEEWQVNRNHNSLHLQVNDTLQNGSIVHLETKQLFELGEYEMYQMEGLTRQAAGWRGDIFRYRVCSPTKPEETLVSFDSLQGRLSTWLLSLRLGISYFEVFTVLFFSLFCLLLHMFLYCWLKKLRNQPSQILLSLVIALFFGQLLFFFGVNFTKSKTICIFIASVTHYSFLVAFFCINVMAFDFCRTFFSSVPISRNHRRCLFSI